MRIAELYARIADANQMNITKSDSLCNLPRQIHAKREYCLLRIINNNINIITYRLFHELRFKPMILYNNYSEYNFLYKQFSRKG